MDPVMALDFKFNKMIFNSDLTQYIPPMLSYNDIINIIIKSIEDN